MFVDRLIDTILRPFREITTLFTRANQAKVNVQMDVNRVRTAPQMVRQEMNMAVQPLVQTGKEARSWGGQNTPQAPSNAMVVAQQPEKKKMSWWPWSKKKPAFAVLRSCIRAGISAPTVAKARVPPSVLDRSQAGSRERQVSPALRDIRPRLGCPTEHRWELGRCRLLACP